MAQVGSSGHQLHTVAVVIAFFAILLYYPTKATLLEHHTVLLCILGMMFLSGICTIAISNLAQDETERGQHNYAQMPRRENFLIFTFLILSFKRIVISLMENILAIGVCISGISNILLKCLYIVSISSYFNQLFFPIQLKLITLDDGYKMQVPVIQYQQQTHLVLLGLDQIYSAFRNSFLIRNSFLFKMSAANINKNCTNVMSRIALAVMIVVEVTDFIFTCLRDTGTIQLFSTAPTLSATREYNVTRCYTCLAASRMGNIRSDLKYCHKYNYSAYININVNGWAIDLKEFSHTSNHFDYPFNAMFNAMFNAEFNAMLNRCLQVSRVDIENSTINDFHGSSNFIANMYLAYEQRVLRHIFFSLRLEIMLYAQLVVLDTLLDTDWYKQTEYKNSEQHSGTAKHANQYFGMLKFTIIGILVALIPDYYNNTNSQSSVLDFTYAAGLGSLEFKFVAHHLPALICICHIYQHWRKSVSPNIDRIKQLARNSLSINFACLLIYLKYSVFILVIRDSIHEHKRNPQENPDWVTRTKLLTRLILLVFYFKYVLVKHIYRLLTTEYHKQSHKMQMFSLMLKSDVDRTEGEVKISPDAPVNSEPDLEQAIIGIVVCGVLL